MLTTFDTQLMAVAVAPTSYCSLRPMPSLLARQERRTSTYRKPPLWRPPFGLAWPSRTLLTSLQAEVALAPPRSCDRDIARRYRLPGCVIRDRKRSIIIPMTGLHTSGVMLISSRSIRFSIFQAKLDSRVHCPRACFLVRYTPAGRN